MKKMIIVIMGLILTAGQVYAANGDLIVDGNVSVGAGVKFHDDTVQTTAASLPVGAITMFCGSTTPTGWMLADGAAVSRSTYSALFATIGTTFGAGDGANTFNLPDFRTVFPKGTGTTTKAQVSDATGQAFSVGGNSQDTVTPGTTRTGSKTETASIGINFIIKY